MFSPHPLTRSLLLIGLALGAVSPAWTAEKGHAHDGHGGAELALRHGQKWPTDAPLRQGMSRARAALAESIRPIHDGKFGPAKYDALARKLSGEVAYIVANCHLDRDADAQLHVVLAQLNGGIERMQGAQPPASRQAGAGQAVAALNAYGEHFDHPGWTALAH